MWKMEVYPDRAGRNRWRLKASNGQTVASSGEAFASKSNADRAAIGFKSGAAQASFEVYATESEKFTWKAKSGNGQTIGWASETFSSRSAAQAAADNVKKNAGGASGP